MSNDLYLIVSPTSPETASNDAGRKNSNPGINLLSIAAGEQAKKRMLSRSLSPAL
jgi:hypothetical protein